ncbi:methyltransferase domain-containing protein [Spirillospora sp. NPDC050679]
MNDRRTPPADRDRSAIVDRYGALARAAQSGVQITDGGPEAVTAGCFGAAAYGRTADLPEAAVRASLGCGDPTAVADLRPGQTVLDLGSGGGLDVLVSARRVAPDGLVYGLDASPDMLVLARANAARAGITNVDFLHGHIEDIPLSDHAVDVVISNCVVNLSTDKPRVLAEAFRVLRPGGLLAVSDVIADHRADDTDRVAAERLIGCAAGTLTVHAYRDLLAGAGFTSITLTPTGDPAGGLHSAVVRAAKPNST